MSSDFVKFKTSKNPDNVIINAYWFDLVWIVLPKTETHDQIRFNYHLADQLNTVVIVESDKAWCVLIYPGSALQ